MSTNRSITAIFVALILTSAAFSQVVLSGSVVEVVDGKTFVLDTVNGQITASIQYVDVPEPEQPLSGLMREHLKRLLLARNVNFIPSGFTPRSIVGRVFIGGIDVGQQLVRDGAAWHIPPERTGQGREEGLAYQGHQNLAKAERRGIWSIEGLTPPWVFRTQKGPLMIDAVFDRSASTPDGSDLVRNYKAARPDLDMWVEVGGDPFSQRNAIGLLFWGFDPVTRIRNTSTPSVAQILSNREKLLEIEIRTIFFQGDIRPRAPSTAFVLALLATSRGSNFAERTKGRLLVDGVQIDLGDGQRFYRGDGSISQEMLQYRISGNQLRQIVSAKKVIIEAGGFSGEAGVSFRNAVQRLLEQVS